MDKFLLFLKENIIYIGIILAIILIRCFIVTPVRVDGPSMNNTLYNGDILLLKKFDKSFDRFDVVVFDYKGSRLVKRIIGLPGEHIRFKDNVLYVNGEEVKQDMIEIKTPDFDISQKGVDVIPKDYYFVVGDNRVNSNDSRYQVGFVKKSDIVGTVNFVLFPFKRFGSFK